MPLTQLSQERRSLPDLIAESLRHAIVRGDIEPGEPLRQEEIAAQFATSRIPVREGLRQLEVEGLVSFHPNRGAVVTKLSPGDIREIFEIRLALETAALRFAIPHHDERTWRDAEGILDAIDREDTANPWGEGNRRFHLALYAPAERPRLHEMIAGLYRNGERYEHKARTLAWYHERAQEEHRRLLDLCRKRDADAAVALLTEHIEAFGKVLVQALADEEKAS